MFRRTFLTTLTCFFLVFNINAQDVFKIRVGSVGNKYVKPKSILNDGNLSSYPLSGFRFVAYDLELPYSSTGLNQIGIMKIDVASNTTTYNILFSFDENQIYSSSVIDMEVFHNKIYVLISINYSDVLLITLNKITGAILKKEFVKVNNNNSQYSNFMPSDLYVTSQHYISDNPQIGILGTFSFGDFNASGFSNITLLYKNDNDNSFTQVKFVNPYKWGALYAGEKILSLHLNGASLISNDIWGYGGITFDYDFGTQTVLNAKHYNISNTPFRFFSQMSYDGMELLYGQLSHSSGNDYSPGQSNDIFIIDVGSQNLTTYNNPNFLAFKGDDHTDSKDVLNLNQTSLIGGYYFSNNHIGNPNYGIMSISFFSNIAPGKAYPLSTKARQTFNPATGVYGGFDNPFFSLTQNINYYSTSNPGAVFERKSKGYWNDLNTLYYMNSLSSSTCIEDFSFTRTFDKALFVNQDFTQVENVVNKTIEDIYIYHEFLSPTPHLAVCDEISSLPDRETNTVFKVDTILMKSANDAILKHNSTKTNIKVYPNPISTTNNITFSNEIEIQSIQIYNVMKQVLFEKRNINAKVHQIQLGVLVPGIYIAVVKDKNDVTSVIKLLK